mmetsp:Transcript_134539/g.335691  ORF Transcript_134539/g.335691 Transcript_134539/m.335691 type:complete len:210 (-) Transcript_134539:2226-2855(-)
MAHIQPIHHEHELHRHGCSKYRAGYETGEGQLPTPYECDSQSDHSHSDHVDLRLQVCHEYSDPERPKLKGKPDQSWRVLGVVMEANFLPEHVCEYGNTQSLNHRLGQDTKRSIVRRCYKEREDRQTPKHNANSGDSVLHLIDRRMDRTQNTDKQPCLDWHHSSMEHSAQNARGKQRPLWPVVSEELTIWYAVGLRDLFPPCLILCVKLH